MTPARTLPPLAGVWAHFFSLKVVIALNAVIAAALEATSLETGILSRKGRDRCGQAFLRVLRRREQIDARA